MAPGLRLEQYSLQQPQVVLRVQAVVDREADQVLIFRGFSSSLVRPTAFDPDVPVLPDTAEIQSIDILVGPYNPDQPQYLQRDLAWAEMEILLADAGC